MKNRRLRKVGPVQGQLDLVKQVFEVDIAGFVDDQPECAALAVFTHVNHAFGKIPVIQTRHRDQKVVREVYRGEIQWHEPILRAVANSGS